MIAGRLPRVNLQKDRALSVKQSKTPLRNVKGPSEERDRVEEGEEKEEGEEAEAACQWLASLSYVFE